MTLHREVNLEAQICDRLAAAGWLHSEGDASGHDRARALFPADVLAWVQASQPKAWETLNKNHGAAAEVMLLDRIRKQMDERGTLEVLRRGGELIGLRAPLALAQFKPALAMNADILTRYHANRLRVVRQGHPDRARQRPSAKPPRRAAGVELHAVKLRRPRCPGNAYTHPCGRWS